MGKNLTILLLVVQLISCQGEDNGSISEQNDSHPKVGVIETSTSKQIEPNPKVGDVKNGGITETNEVISLDSLWNKLVFDYGGCLTGGQRVYKGRFGNEGCVMSEFSRNPTGWSEFFAHSEGELTPFLIKKFSDTTSTKIHTCPCMVARNGEVAVYALQNIYKKNWYDLNGFEQYASKETSSCLDSQQSWLWDILENEERREKLAEEWLKQKEN
tara:strand:+ start:3361 stop:4002 length:642 start_codon:yes stop_codon:yes gene_type:complete